MAQFIIEGLDELEKAIREIGNVPDEVLSSALTEIATAAASRIRETGDSMGVRDADNGEHILDRIKVGRAKMTTGGGRVDVTFPGSRVRGSTTTRNAEIAFVNEYGSRKQQARPFIGTAMSRNEAQIVEAGAKIIEDWIEKTFSE